MPRVRYSVRSRRDVDGVADRISDDSLIAAKRWLDETDRVLRLLALHPEASEEIETRRFGVIRRHSHGNYVIYYRPRTYGIFVLRVLHGARDHKSLL